MSVAKSLLFAAIIALLAMAAVFGFIALVLWSPALGAALIVGGFLGGAAYTAAREHRGDVRWPWANDD